jgi:HD-GYP domain-containing protein (c-di-GMP phosphodiesterase class II)
MVEFRKILSNQMFAPEAVSNDTVVDLGKGFTLKNIIETNVIQNTDEAFYRQGVSLAADILECIAGDPAADFPFTQKLVALMDALCNRLERDDGWKLLCMARSASRPDYLPSHMMNVCILATHLARHLSWPDDDLADLAKAAFLHDIGMMRVPHIWDSLDVFTPDDLARIESHPMESCKIVEANGLVNNPIIARATAEHHERTGGQGYPGRKLSDQISKAGDLLAVIDIFEAITHPRPFRDGKKPFEAIRIISTIAGQQLASDIVRRFLQVMSIYPIGSFVRLNNGKIARVIKSNEKFLTKPVVQIVNPAAHETDAGSIVDLKFEKIIFVKEAVTLDALDSFIEIV